jgi:hypothetical protein
MKVCFVVGERERRHSDAERAEIVRQLDEIEETQREILRLLQP